MNDIEHLAALLPQIVYPPGIRCVIPSIAGPAFFPGGTGVVLGRDVRLRRSVTTLPRGGVMVLGHNFHNVTSYERSLAHGREDDNNPTWRNLTALLDACGLSIEQCFLTNALMGLIEGASATGSVPGHKDAAFRLGCRTVFETSVALQQPQLILALGIPAIRFLGEVLPALSRWKGVTSFRQLDGMGAVAHDVPLPGCPTPAQVVALIHPSMRHGNLRHRLGWLPGIDPEVELIRSVLRK